MFASVFVGTVQYFHSSHTALSARGQILLFWHVNRVAKQVTANDACHMTPVEACRVHGVHPPLLE